LNYSYNALFKGFNNELSISNIFLFYSGLAIIRGQTGTVEMLGLSRASEDREYNMGLHNVDYIVNIADCYKGRSGRNMKALSVYIVYLLEKLSDGIKIKEQRNTFQL
jgi:hypothetical protein